MTTRNLVPRADSQGKIGISGTRWEEVNAVTIKATSLQNSNGSSLLVNDAGIKDIATVNNQLVIALDGTFLTDRLGFNADSTKPDFTLPNGDALPNNTIIAAGDSLVAAIQKLNDELRDVAAPSDLTVASFAAAAIVLEGEGISGNDNDTTLPTSAAVKDYVDSQLTSQDLDFQGDAGGALSVDLDSEVLTIAGGTGLSTSGAGQTLTVNLDNTAVVAGSYGDATNIATFTVDAQGRLTAAGTAAISTSFTLSADAGDDDTFNNGGTLTFTGDTGITTTVSDDTITIDLDDTAVTPGAYGSATAIPTFTVDQQGRLTAAGTVGITTVLTVDSDGAGTQDVSLADDDLQILGGVGLTSSIAKANNEVTVTLTLDDTAVAANQYGDADSVGQFTVDAQGRLTQAAAVDISIASSQVNDATAANTASKIVLRDGDGNFAAGTITANLTGNVTGDLTGNADTATAWATGRTIELTGDVTGTSAAFDGSGNLSFATTIAENSVALGTDTTGDYVQSLVAGAGVSLSNNSGESATPTIAVDGVLEDLDTLGAAQADGEFIVATGAGAFAYESGDTARTSLGLGTGDSPEFSGLTLDNQGSLVLQELNANAEGDPATVKSISIQAPAQLTASYSLTLPTNDGDQNQILTTDGDGALSWTTVNAIVDAVESFSIIAVQGQDNIVAGASEATLTIAAGDAIAITTAANTDTLTIAVSGITNNQIANNAAIADTKLATISTANKVALTALDIDGGADIGADLVDADLIIVDDGAGGTNKISEMSRVATFINNHTSITTLSSLSSVGSNGATLTAAGNLTISGNLIVNGDSTTVTTSTLAVQDSLISLAKDNNASDTLDIGFYGLYDSTDDNSQDSYAGLFRDADDDGKFKLFKDLQVAPTATVNTAAAGYSKATLVADLEGNVTGTVSSLANHDTADLTEGANLYFTDARARGAISVEDAGGDGSLTYANGTGVLTYTGPSAAETRAHFSAGSGIGISNGAISLDISAIAEVQVAANDKFLMLDSDGSTEQLESINDIATFMAGDGLSATNGVLAVSTGAGLEVAGDVVRIAAAAAGNGLTGGGGSALDLDLNGLTAAAALDVSADSFAIIDAAQGADTNLTRKQTIAGLVTAVAGSGLSATNGVLALDISEIGDGAIASGDKFLMLDADGSTEQLESVDDIAAFMAGTGIAASSGSLSLDLNELTSAAIDVSADSIAIIDSDNNNSTKKESIADLMTAAAGAGLTANAGVLAISTGKGLEVVNDAVRIAASAAGTGLTGGGDSSLELDLNELTPVDVNVSADSIAIIDADDNGTKKESIADLMTAVAGTGIAASNGSLSLDLNELTAAAALDVSADSIAIIDAAHNADTNLTRKQTISGLMTAAAGAGLTANAGVLAISTGTGLEVVNDAVRIAASAAGNGLAGGGDSALALDLNELTPAVVNVSADSIAIIDADDSGTKKESIADFISAIAGTGIAASNGSLSLDVNELAESDVDVSADSIVILDAANGDDTNLTRRETISDFVSGITSTGLTASGGQVSLNYDNSTIGIIAEGDDAGKVEVKDSGVTLAKLANLDNMKVIGNTSGDAATPTAIDILDEDTMSSDSATSLVTQQSVKAYVDGKLGRHGGVFLTDSADNDHANDNYNRDVIFSSAPIIRSHFGPFAFSLNDLHTLGGSDIIFYGSTSFQSSDRHFEVNLNTTADELTTNMYDTEFTGANENTP